jgi:hypothetical protein
MTQQQTETAHSYYCMLMYAILRNETFTSVLTVEGKQAMDMNLVN